MGKTRSRHSRKKHDTKQYRKNRHTKQHTKQHTKRHVGRKRHKSRRKYRKRIKKRTSLAGVDDLQSEHIFVKFPGRNPEPIESQNVPSNQDYNLNFKDLIGQSEVSLNNLIEEAVDMDDVGTQLNEKKQLNNFRNLIYAAMLYITSHGSTINNTITFSTDSLSEDFITDIKYNNVNDQLTAIFKIDGNSQHKVIITDPTSTTSNITNDIVPG